MMTLALLLLLAVQDQAKVDAAIKNPYFSNGPKHAASTHYYLYAMERAGVLYGTETFGAHAWYGEGARWLLETQRPDGAWFTAGSKGSREVWDTCFAILFLRRATRPLIDVASEDRPKGR